MIVGRFEAAAVAARALARRPGLWAEAARTGRSLVPRRGHWRGGGAAAWLRFRAETAYGDAAGVPSGSDLLGFLAWSREERAAGAPMRRRARRAR